MKKSHWLTYQEVQKYVIVRTGLTWGHNCITKDLVSFLFSSIAWYQLCAKAAVLVPTWLTTMSRYTYFHFPKKKLLFSPKLQQTLPTVLLAHTRIWGQVVGRTHWFAEALRRCPFFVVRVGINIPKAHGLPPHPMTEIWVTGGSWTLERQSCSKPSPLSVSSAKCNQPCLTGSKLSISRINFNPVWRYKICLYIKVGSTLKWFDFCGRILMLRLISASWRPSCFMCVSQSPRLLHNRNLIT